MRPANNVFVAINVYISMSWIGSKVKSHNKKKSLTFLERKVKKKNTRRKEWIRRSPRVVVRRNVYESGYRSGLPRALFLLLHISKSINELVQKLYTAVHKLIEKKMCALFSLSLSIPLKSVSTNMHYSDSVLCVAASMDLWHYKKKEWYYERANSSLAYGLCIENTYRLTFFPAPFKDMTKRFSNKIKIYYEYTY